MKVALLCKKGMVLIFILSILTSCSLQKSNKPQAVDASPLPVTEVPKVTEVPSTPSNSPKKKNVEATPATEPQPVTTEGKREKPTRKKEHPQEEIKKAIDSNKIYEIDFSTDYNEEGRIGYDFNNDGKIETINYSTFLEKSKYGYTIVKKCRVSFGGMSAEYEYTDNLSTSLGIYSIGIMDVNRNDNFVEFYISDDNLADRVKSRVYRLTDKGIEQIGDLGKKILAYSGDGKIYYWGGNLYETGGDGAFNRDLVLVYYDIDKRQYVQTNQIEGKTITANYPILLYKIREDVVSGAPRTQQEIYNSSKAKIVKTIKPGEKFTVLSTDGVIRSSEVGDQQLLINGDDGVLVKTEDGKQGWIGGFHMVWD